MKLKPYEMILLCLACMAVVFTAGFFTGRLTGRNTIYVSTEPQPEELTVSAGTAEDKVNLNTADAEELTGLPGIGPELAQAIVEYREEHGGFTVPSELMNISGIGSATYEMLEDYVTVSG